LNPPGNIQDFKCNPLYSRVKHVYISLGSYISGHFIYFLSNEKFFISHDNNQRKTAEFYSRSIYMYPQYSCMIKVRYLVQLLAYEKQTASPIYGSM